MPVPFTQETLVGTLLRSWTIKEYETYNRGQWWYILMITLGLGLVIYAIVSGNFVFALIIILSGIILFLQSQQTPQNILIQCTDLGIIIGTKFYSYDEFEGFYIIYTPPEVQVLFLKTKSALRPLIRISLEGENPVEVRQLLLEFLNEDVEVKTEPLSDLFARQWKIH